MAANYVQNTTSFNSDIDNNQIFFINYVFRLKDVS